MKSIMNNHPILVKKVLYVGNLSPVFTKEELYKLFGFKTIHYFKKTCKAELSVCPKMGNSRCFTYVTVPYHTYNEIVKLNGVVFKSKTDENRGCENKAKTKFCIVTAIQNFWKQF